VHHRGHEGHGEVGGRRVPLRRERAASADWRLLARKMRALPRMGFPLGVGLGLILACDLQGRKVEWAYGLGLACRD
jgi:hypothetical protein